MPLKNILYKIHDYNCFIPETYSLKIQDYRLNCPSKKFLQNPKNSLKSLKTFS